jgi:hypothetical protein
MTLKRVRPQQACAPTRTDHEERDMNNNNQMTGKRTPKGSQQKQQLTCELGDGFSV